MDAGAWPPPPRRPDLAAPSPDLAPPRPDVEAPSSDAAERRTRRRRAAVAALLAVALVATAIGAATGGSPGRLVGAGDGQYRFLERLPDGQPYRWDPCVPIHYEVNLAHAPSGALDDVRQALARVTDASGFRFVFDGTTARTADTQIGQAFQSALPGQARWLPLLFVWIPHEHFDFLVDTHRAAAFGVPRTGDGAAFATYESGLVAVDSGDDLPVGFDARYSLGVVLMHELGHVMGLAHVASGEELMWSPTVRGADPRPDFRLNDWGPGDRRGLEILGDHGACPNG